MAAAVPLTRVPAPARRPAVTVGFPIVLALILGAISLVPYLLAYAWTPPGKHFAGFFFIADDATTYLAKMREGADGAWLWTDPYTSEAHRGVFLFAFYLLLGHLAALLHLPLVAAYHLARVTGGVALVLAVDRLARRLLAPDLRRLAVVLTMLAAGLGFVAQTLGTPGVLGMRLEALDLHLPELTGWYSLLAIPHFAWATTLIVLALIGLLDLQKRPAIRPLLLTGLWLTALAAIHPQMIPVLAIIWAAYRLVRWRWRARPAARSLLAEAAAFAIPIPLLLYNAWVLYTDPTIALWAKQWKHQAPNILSLLISLGLPLAAAAYAMALTWRRRDRELALLAVWPPLVIALLYLPNVANIQRRLLDALYVPLGFLAAVGLRALLARWPRRAARLERILVPLFCLSSALVLAIALRFASGVYPEIYLSADQVQAMNWLSTHHERADRVLSSPGDGLYIPAWSGVPVYVGHYSETLDYFGKIRTADAMLQATTPPAQLRSFFHDNGMTLLYWGPQERQDRSFDPGQEPFLGLVYAAGGVRLYRVIGGA
ncbi:MAG TPA: hypothetical protein VET82_13275 [Candidatus Eisenbacteria bacterium]|nr:hypothetical protein [Candidatus Eisenbacteria bacterium]